jgi:hypothetical protein
MVPVDLLAKKRSTPGRTYPAMRFLAESRFSQDPTGHFILLRILLIVPPAVSTLVFGLAEQVPRFAGPGAAKQDRQCDYRTGPFSDSRIPRC